MAELDRFFAKPELARFPIDDDFVTVSVTSRSDVANLAAELTAIGMKESAISGPNVGGLLPLGALDDLANLSDVIFARLMYDPVTDIGDVASQGDKSMRSEGARNRFNVGSFTLNGAGVTIGVMSDSYNAQGGETGDVVSGDLPGVGNPNGYTTPVVVADEFPSGGDEGQGDCAILGNMA